MTDRKKKIIALTIASTMLVSLTGCKKQKVNISKNIDDYYVVVLKDDNDYKVFLTNNNSNQYNSIYSSGTIVKKSDNTCISDKGTVSGIYPFCLYFEDYEKGKNYTEEEINEKFDGIKDDYEYRNKKLTLK